MPTPSTDTWLFRHRLELGLALRMTAAGLISAIVGDFIGLAQVYWAVLTAVIVTQTSLGGSLKAVLDRFVGTLGGAAWGVAVAALVPHGGTTRTIAALAIALVPLSVLVALRPGYRVAPVTAVIVLLGRVAQGGALAAAFDRVTEIGFGSVVALAVAIAVPPARAHRLLLSAARDALEAMAEQIVAVLAGVAVPLDPDLVRSGHDRVRAAIEKVQTIAGEVAQERRSYLTGAPDAEPIERALRRLGHDLVILSRCVPEPLPDLVVTRLAAPAETLGEAAGEYIGGLGLALVGLAGEPSSAALDRAAAAYNDTIAGLRGDGVTRALSGADVERVFGLGFALEQTCRNLADLAARVREFRHHPGIGG